MNRIFIYFLLLIITSFITNCGNNSPDKSVSQAGQPTQSPTVLPLSQYTIGGTIEDLAPETILTLENNTRDTLSVPASGGQFTSFTFQTPLPERSSYHVTIVQPFPINPSQTCQIIYKGSGIVGHTNTPDVKIKCSIDSFPLEVEVKGLKGGTLILVNDVEKLPISANGIFSFLTSIQDQMDYKVIIGAQPSAPLQAPQICTLTNNIGKIDMGAKIFVECK